MAGLASASQARLHDPQCLTKWLLLLFHVVEQAWQPSVANHTLSCILIVLRIGNRQGNHQSPPWLWKWPDGCALLVTESWFYYEVVHHRINIHLCVVSSPPRYITSTGRRFAMITLCVCVCHWWPLSSKSPLDTCLSGCLCHLVQSRRRPYKVSTTTLPIHQFITEIISSSIISHRNYH